MVRRLRGSAGAWGWAAVAGLSVLAAALCRAGTNYTDNPNQTRWKFSDEMNVPCIVWAKPLAGGPVQATVIAPSLSWTVGYSFAYRDVVELCQRLAVRVTPVMTADFTTIPYAEQHNCAYPDLGDPPDVWMALVQERLRQPADVVVIGKVQWRAFAGRQAAGGWEKGAKWDAFTYDLRATIVDRVKAGGGLLYIGAALTKGAGGEVGLPLPTGDGTASAGAQVALTKVNATDTLLRGMTGLQLPALGGRDWSDRVYTGALGAGRVLVLDYAGDTSPEHCLAPAPPAAGEVLCSYEYVMSFIARAVRWCAGRELPTRIEQITADPVQGLNVSVANRPADATLTVELRDVTGETGHVVQTWAAAAPPLALPKLADGVYYANAWLRNGRGEVLDWGSARLAIAVPDAAKPLFRAIELREPAARAGQAIAGDVVLAGPWPAGDLLRLSATDPFGRCVWRHEVKAATERTPFALTPEWGRSVALILRAERVRRGETSEARERTVCLATKDLDGDFAAIIWSGFGADERFNRQDLGVLRRLGFDAAYLVGPRFREACARANLRVLWNCDRVTAQSAYGFCHPQKVLGRWGKLYRDEAATTQAQAPLALTFGDETFYGAIPQLTPPYSDPDFRLFLAQRYPQAGGGLDLAALNQAWGTAYQTTDEITVKPMDELRAAKARAQGVCEALWAEWQFHRLLTAAQQAGQGEAPLTYFGDEGVGHIEDSMGHDYYRLGRDLTLFQLYDSGAGPFLAKSFARPDSLRGLWTGNYGYYEGAVDEEWSRSRPWRSLFYGMNSEWWWMHGMSVCADGRPIPAIEQYGEEVRRIKAGPATLLLKVARPCTPQVGVLYSPDTVHVHTFDHAAPGPHPAALATACQGLIRAGYAFRLLHPTQLDDERELAAGYRVLVLPAILALSASQAATIRQFVARGGLLIADQAPAQYINELGRPYGQDPLRAALTPGADATTFTHGQGRAIFLADAFSLSHLVRYKDTLGQTASEKSGKPLARLFREWIAAATGCQPPLSFMLGDGNPLTDGEISPFADGAALYVGLDRNGRYWEGEQCRWLTWPDYQEEVTATLTGPPASHVYDVTRGEYLGPGPAVSVKLSSAPRLFAVLPSPVTKLAITGLAKTYRPGQRLACQVNVVRGAGGGCAAVLHIAVRQAKAATLPAFDRNVIAAAGVGQVALPLALDEAPGNYTLEARDVATGVAASATFQIR